MYTGFMKSAARFIGALVVCFFPGIIGSWFTYPAIASWYVYLNKPFFNPPNWIFGPVWSLLYLLMGISLFLVWESKRKSGVVRKAGKYFFLQLGLNTAWSLIFFGLKNPAFAFLEILILWASILATIRIFLNINKTAGTLLLPYFAWVSFATILNFAIVLLN